MDLVAQLNEIAVHFDNGMPLTVGNGGVVQPVTESVIPSHTGRGDQSEQRRQSEPSTRPWEETSGWKGSSKSSPGASPGAFRATSSTTSLVNSLTDYISQTKSELEYAYPQSHILTVDGGFWLIAESRLLIGVRPSALFAVAISEKMEKVKGWAFWHDPLIPTPNWIGPRHTNFKDGSICAFEPTDGTWIYGDPIVKLLDLYSSWAVRQLCLAYFGRWPGPQVGHYQGERLLETKEDELCPCGSMEKTYEQCCAVPDRSRGAVSSVVNYLTQIDNPPRRALPEVQNFVSSRSNPPDLEACLQARRLI